ncbi:MAG: alpha/beta hydrolase [Sphingobium sp.]
MLVLPGITSPAATWLFVARHLASDRRVVVADIRGRGLSDSRPGLGYGLDDYVADALGMIAAIGLERPIILGHSMGARIAIRLAATSPTVPVALILADPPLTGPGRTAYPTPIESYLSAHTAASNGASIDQFRLLNPSWSDDQIALRLEWLPTCCIEAITQTHANFHSEDIHTDLPKITCPTLLIRAANANVVTPEGAAEVVALLRQGRVEAVTAGHMIPWENLPEFLAIVRRFLEYDCTDPRETN